MNSKTVGFYDKYHKQNDRTNKLINRDNITYWHIIRLVEKSVGNFSDKKILDIGCGVGTLSFYFSNMGAIVLGVDVSDRAIQLAKHTQLQTGCSSVKFIQSSLSGTDEVSAPKKRYSRWIRSDHLHRSN
jgi:2-polyprenyl-3-methyl-5-hydroxy-6-metoxy-1,4-benzoquinol methylase